jgi:hypothetical protein
MPHVMGHNWYEQEPYGAFSDFSGESIWGVPNPMLLEQMEPEAAFYSAFDPRAMTPNMRQFLPQAFRQAHNEFLGSLGAQIRQGEATPTGMFGNFAAQFPLMQRFQESQFGPQFGGQQFNPSTRSLFNF